MTIYKTDFSEYTVDQAPADWTERWHTDKYAPLVKSGGTYGKYLLLTSSANDRYGISWDDAGTPTETEILTLISGTENTTAKETFRVLLRGSGDSSTETGWGMIAYAYDNYFNTGHYTNGTGADWVTTNVTINPNTKYWVRFRANSTAIKIKIWEYGTAEPVAWTREITDAHINQAGWAGVGGYYGNISCDFFAVATNGETIPIYPSEMYSVGVIDAASWGASALYRPFLIF